ncbi:MarP family serine protease [Mycolicibacterium holsaticum]|uniref:MarP family serine protease n=1 Tax=Mycolicibacterium holsaticum TaxID=152142 RepID=UPI000A05BEE1|nr:MarP family serine protease [Mycolicibacterium holsaticum]QZA10870.1 MarP family serine protease [Mycolicibacterium holsaticum DSM 44478 = JCM 12374]UNC11630.1 MarP family serine protease [Mycolicibacterium holsaticum DSM 44478 = JCM 12374]
MRPIRRVVTVLAAALTAAGISGCSGPWPAAEVAMPPVEAATIAAVDPPDAALANSPVIAQAHRSVAKVHSMAPSCQKLLDGSGVVFAPHRVMSSAHGVAGATEITVSVDGGEYPATVVFYDPDADVSILDVPGLEAPALAFAEETAPSGADALILGYPGGGPFVATPARVRDLIELSGPDIYRTKTVHREVYIVRGGVRQGGSGGPLIDLNSRILGLAFGASVEDPDSSFVLTGKQLFGIAVNADSSAPVPTGDCVG